MITQAISQVQLGTTGPVVGAPGQGCMGMSECYGETDPDSARRTLKASGRHLTSLVY